MSTIRTAAALVAAFTAVLALSACGSSDTSDTDDTPTGPAGTPAASAAPARHDDADVAFVQGMIPHHAQAVQMSRMAAGRTTDDRVTALADRIARAQGPEIQEMRGYLASWGVPESVMDHGGMTGMTGMMSDEQMQQLGQARGAAFDRMFLAMMTQHHEGAVQMARTELAQGSSPQAKGLAQRIIDSQQAEIAEMGQLLAAA